MFGTWFYHERIRKSVATFGRLFNDIYVIRTDASGNPISQIKVPLSYAPKQKFIERIRENPDLYNDEKIAVKLPRMSFEIVNISYDSPRQLQKNNTFIRPGTSNTISNKFFAAAPYTITFQLSIYAKNQDDALQIVEQIIPYFNPQYTVTIKPFGDFSEIKEDVPVILNGVVFTDDFEGTQEQRRTIIYSLDFDMKVNFYGPTNQGKIIRTAKADLGIIGLGLYDSDIAVERITVVPDPIDATGDSDFGFTTTIDLLYDNDSA
jgi:hypothetical protein